MNFIETRGNDGSRPAHVSFSQAILNPMASFGGLRKPEERADVIAFLREQSEAPKPLPAVEEAAPAAEETAPAAEEAAPAESEPAKTE